MRATDEDVMLKPGDPLYDRIARIKAHCDGYKPEHVDAYPPEASSPSYLAGVSMADLEAQMHAVWAAASAQQQAEARTAAETIIEGTYTFISETDA